MRCQLLCPVPYRVRVLFIGASQARTAARAPPGIMPRGRVAGRRAAAAATAHSVALLQSKGSPLVSCTCKHGVCRNE
jgi:hypothetical protein